MSGHTPGPWTIRKIFNRHWEILNSAGYWIGRARGEENAHLIAAAPDLLAALIDVRDNARDDSPEMWARVDAAIAKATGEQA